MGVKVVHLITGLGTGGAERMLTRLVTAPGQDGVRHAVVSMMDEGAFGEEIRAAGVPLDTLGMRRGLPSPMALWRLVRLLRHERPDVLMTWLYHADLLGLMAGRLAGVKRIYWNLRCSDMEMSDYSPLSRALPPLLARLSPLLMAVVVNSEAGKRHHAGLGYAPRAWHVIGNGIDLDRFHPSEAARARLGAQLGVPADAVLVGHVARFDPMKDHATLTAAAAEVLAAHPSVHFVLAGEGVKPDNPALPRHPRIHLLGPRPDVPIILAGLDLFAFSSAYGEGSPNAVLEAMACGLCCAVTDVGDAALMVGETGRVVPPRDAKALARAIVELLALPARARHELGLAARARIAAHYGIADVVARYRALFEGKSAP